jgi:hypothetical protein
MVPPRTSRIDLWLGLAVAVAAVVAMAWVIPAWVPVFSSPRPVALAPWMLPQAAAAILGLAGLALAWRARAGGAPPEATLWRGLGLGAGGVAGYVILMPLLGAVGAGGVMTALLVLARKGSRAWPAAFGTAALATALAWTMFVPLAGTPLPRGPWGF